jgi:D-alanyl-D-alanine carboxypeptidase
MTRLSISEYSLPAISIAVRDAAGRIHKITATSNKPGKLTPVTGMPGGSTGKSFVAATVMLLVEEGLLHLDDPVSNWLGQHEWYSRLPNHDSMLIRHLLSHTAGLNDHVDSIRYQLTAGWRLLTRGTVLMTTDEAIQAILDDEPLDAPGKHFAYTDTGYLLLGLIIEQATGKQYYDVLTQRILSPAGLTDARPAIARNMLNVLPGHIEPRFPTSLAGFSGSTHSDGLFRIHPLTEWTGGGLVTTPTMLVSFYSKLAEGEIVSAWSFEQMKESIPVDNASPNSRYGFGLYVIELEGLGTAIGHGGWFPGYRTTAYYFLDRKIAVAIQTNRDGEFDLNKFLWRLARGMIER